MRPLKACRMAFELDENDNSVLCKIGKILRKAKYFQDSREIMEKARELRPSSTVFHQLGLTYTAIASEKKREENGQPSKSDPFVTEAMKCFEDAFEFSAGTNLQAKYDLALMHRRIGERDKALPLLEEILHSNRERSNYITVNAYEQTGLILKEKCEAEADEQKKNQLESEAESMLYMALTKAASLYSTIPQFQGHIQEMWNSFSELLQEADESDLNAIQKLGKKADLLRLISQNEQSMALLNEIRQMAPDEKQDPLHLKLCVENYVALQEFEKALAFIKLLRCTSKGRATLAQFDEHYELEVRIQAARQALLTGSVFKSKKHFYTAFIDTVMQAQPDSTDTSESDSSDSDPMTWDVMMIYNRREETFVQCRSHAQILERLLRDVFDLRVTVMDDANRLGRANDRDEMVRTMRRSRLVLVLAGSHKICCDMQMLVGQACRPNCNTVTLLTDVFKWELALSKWV
nr:hypothetical protein BaRGS_031600 [Batillaria attramentaria]